MTIALPRLMDGTRLHPLRLSVTLNLRPVSRASMLLPPEEALPLRALVELFTPQGSAGLFRVTAVEQVPGEGSEVTLRHTAALLSDALIPGTDELTGAPRAVLAALLSRQTAPERWVLGDVELPETRTLSCAYNNSNLLTALCNILDELPDYALIFDQTGDAWRVHLRRLIDEDACECRLSRNLSGVTVSRDDSDLCTRVYVSGLPAPVDAPSAAQWGTVSRAIAANPRLGSAALTQLARQYLEQHSQPAVTVRLSALDLYGLTGEPLDSFRLGRVCRVALPDSGETIRERVVSIAYPDVYGEPERAELTLADRAQDAADYVGGLMANVALVYRGLADANGLIRLEADRIELLAQEIQLKASSDVVDGLERRTTLAEIDIDGLKGEILLKASQKVVDELGSRLSKAEIDIDGANAEITLKASRKEVEALSYRLSQAEIDIDGANAQITLKADRAETDLLGRRLASAEVAIDGAKAEIALKVSKNGVISAINLSSEGAVIEAKRINLKGYVTATELAAEFAGIETQFSSYFSAREIEAGSVDANLIYGEEIVAHDLSVAGYGAEWLPQTVVTSVTLPEFTSTTLNYLDHNGNKKSLYIPIRQSAGYVSRKEINYLGR